MGAPESVTPFFAVRKSNGTALQPHSGSTPQPTKCLKYRSGSTRLSSASTRTSPNSSLPSAQRVMSRSDSGGCR